MISETKYMPGYKNKKLKDDLCSSKIVTYDTDCKLIKIFKQKTTHKNITEKLRVAGYKENSLKDSHRYQNWIIGNFKGLYSYLF
jgi:hypothetical protein